MEAYRFNTKHNAELFQYAVLSHRLNRGKYRAKLEGFTVTTNAPEDIIDSAYKDLGAYGRDPRRVRKTAQGPYQVVQRERVVKKGLDRATALKAAQTLARRTKKPVRVEKVTVVSRRKKTSPVAVFGYDGKRLAHTDAFGKKMRARRDEGLYSKRKIHPEMRRIIVKAKVKGLESLTRDELAKLVLFKKKLPYGRDVTRADLKHLSLGALMKLLRQAMKSGDEDKAEMIGKELDRRGKGF